MERNVRTSDASPRALVFPAPIDPVMTSNDFVILPPMFKDAMPSEVGAIGYLRVMAWSGFVWLVSTARGFGVSKEIAPPLNRKLGPLDCITMSAPSTRVDFG